MDDHSPNQADALAERTTRLMSHLDGVLDEHMLDALAGVWSTLEHASADAPAHARAVRSRLFWESLAPGGPAASPAATVHELTPRQSDADDEDLLPGLDAEAA